MFEHKTNVSHGSCEVNPGTVTRRIDSRIVMQMESREM